MSQRGVKGPSTFPAELVHTVTGGKTQMCQGVMEKPRVSEKGREMVEADPDFGLQPRVCTHVNNTFKEMERAGPFMFTPHAETLPLV